MNGPLGPLGPDVVPWLMLAGAAGALLRLACDHWLPRAGIVVVNVAGSLVAGLVTGWAHGTAQASGGTGDAAALLTVLVTGLAGALTTFSTVSVSTARDVARGRWGAVLGGWAVHLGLGFAAVVLGLLGGAALAVR